MPSQLHLRLESGLSAWRPTILPAPDAQLPYCDELDDYSLVDERNRVFDARGILLRGLVQTARELCAFAIFVQRYRGGGHRRVRVSDDACRDSRAIPSTRALDTRASVGAHYLVRHLRKTLFPCRTAMARMEYLRPADTGIDSQFHFYVEY